MMFRFYYRISLSIVITLAFFSQFCLGITREEMKNTPCTGQKYFRNYTYLEYDHLPQNWFITQDPRGCIYVGNLGGVLVYDGVTWELANIPYMPVRSLAIGKDGYIYMGGKEDFGYFSPNSRGFLEYISLKSYFDPQYGNTPEVWDTVATNKGVYFRAQKLLFRWNYKTFDFFREGSFGPLCLCDGKLIIQQGKIGLLDILDVEDVSLKPIPGTGALAKKRVWMITPFKTGDGSRCFLVGTRTGGLLVYRNGTLVPFVTEADDFLQKNKITHGIRLSTGQYAIATQKGGMVIIDAYGQVKYIFDNTNGLQDNEVKWIMEDNLGNIWLALAKGISRLEYRSPFYYYDDRTGLGGITITVAMHKNKLYVGTTQGIYVLRPQAKSFTIIPGTGPCWALLSTGSSLLAATEDGVSRVDTGDGIPQIIYPGVQAYGMALSNRFPGYIWGATQLGLVAMAMKDTHWQIEYSYNEIKDDIRGIVEDPAGFPWLLTSQGKILKVSFPNGIASPVVTRYGKEKGIYEGDIYMAAVKDHVVFASPMGIFKYDEKKDVFIPDLLLGKDYAYDRENQQGKPVFRIAPDVNNNIWFHSQSRNYRAFFGPNNEPVIDDGPFRRIPIMQVNGIFPGPDGRNIWFAGIEGLIRYDTGAGIKWNTGFPAVIQKVIVNETTPVFGRYLNKKGNLPLSEFPFNQRDISFQCGAPFFEQESAALFRYQLEGYSPDWTGWTGESRKHYTNLDPGEYTFHVQAKNVYDVTSREDTFSFQVLPPWYRTWWAYVLYGIVLVIAFNFAVKWRSRLLIREKEKLEQVVKDRTGEIREKNTQLEQQTLQLQDQSEKLREMDQVKSRFFANISHEFRTPLTLIVSPLEQMLSWNPDVIHKKNYLMMLRNAQQLLTLINRLLELARIDSGKMSLHTNYQDIVPFLKNMVTSFQGLAQQKQLTLESIFHEEKILLYFDLEKMEEVMYNLLSNAVKFTPPGGGITVSLSLESTPRSFARVSVKDTGIGIPADQLPYVFDRFFQAGQAKDKSFQGTGLGLSLTRELILLHHGEIDVQSEEQKGTEFILRLPLEKDHLSADEIAAAPISPIRRDRTKDITAMLTRPADDDEGLLSEEHETAAHDKNSSTGESPVGEPGKISVLVVEDHDDMRKHIREMLAPEYQILEAVDGKEGIEKAKEFVPDLIISDIMMPHKDGYELCRVLKKEIKTSHIPIILLTARASERSVIKGLETKADDYITKPFNQKMLLVRIKNLVELRRQMQLKIQREKMLLPSEIPVSNQDDLFLKEFQAVIEKNLDDEDFNIDVLCKKLLVSRATLFKKIQVLTGETPNQFIQSYRLERGAQMLRDNYGNVTEVAMAVGFSSPQYFAKCFKERFHRSPKAFQASETKQS